MHMMTVTDFDPYFQKILCNLMNCFCFVLVCVCVNVCVCVCVYGSGKGLYCDDTRCLYWLQLSNVFVGLGFLADRQRQYIIIMKLIYLF